MLRGVPGPKNEFFVLKFTNKIQAKSSWRGLEKNELP